ncbi:uncharacterized protein DSM5745_02688 [Aspergillus mulundensis]|uniref:Uncharacterized protein n=1 Tax=Aspergillus mulundensis TaxID=1810919 RepID=A0A3D8SIB5_9EURO|nr:hypothetical protein DSM5745_02688 [Aspergillus mulundensis]RDW86046.1 hypothetical protein DSM5745_02688 [Aspergillus mulundensis]
MPRPCSSPTNQCAQCTEIYQQMLYLRKVLGEAFPEEQHDEAVLFPRLEVYPFVLTHVFPLEVVEVTDRFMQKISVSIRAWFKENYGTDKINIFFLDTEIENKYHEPGTHISVLVDAPESMVATQRDVERMLELKLGRFRYGWTYRSFEDMEGCTAALRLEFLMKMLPDPEEEEEEEEEEEQRMPARR